MTHDFFRRLTEFNGEVGFSFQSISEILWGQSLLGQQLPTPGDEKSYISYEILHGYYWSFGSTKGNKWWVVFGGISIENGVAKKNVDRRKWSQFPSEKVPLISYRWEFVDIYYEMQLGGKSPLASGSVAWYVPGCVVVYTISTIPHPLYRIISGIPWVFGNCYRGGAESAIRTKQNR